VLGAHVHHAALRASAVQVRIRPANNTRLSRPRWWKKDRSRIGLPISPTSTPSQQKPCLESRIAASNKHRGSGAPAGPVCTTNVQASAAACSPDRPAEQVLRADHACGPSWFWGLWGRCPCRGDDNSTRPHHFRLKHHVALYVVELTGVKAGRLNSAGSSWQKPPGKKRAGTPRSDLKAAIGGGYGRGSLGCRG